MSTKKTPNVKPLVKISKPLKPTQPWGQALLRARAQELLHDGVLAPSVIMGNLLAAAASSVVDLEMLLAQPRPMSVAANRVIADALHRSRLPYADISSILSELVVLAWQPKRGQVPTKMPSHHQPAKEQRPIEQRSKTDAKKPVPRAQAPKPPVIVRHSSKPSSPSN